MKFRKRKKLTGMSNYRCALRTAEILNNYDEYTDRDRTIADLWFIKEKGPTEIAEMQILIGRRGNLGNDMISLEINRLYNGLIEYDEKHKESQRTTEELKEHQRLRKTLITDNPDACCACCGSKENLQIDHIIAYGIGGTTEERNIQVLCEKCHKEKTQKERNEYGWNKSPWLFREEWEGDNQ